MVEQAITRRTAALQNVAYYVFNDKSNHRFVIVSGDKRQHEVLGISDNSEFEVNNIPCGLMTFLKLYGEEYQYIQTNDYTMSDEATQGNRASDVSEESMQGRRATSVSPLIKTKWDQSPVYNEQCPSVKGVKCVTGCVATAMAQVMNYYQYPERGDGIVKLLPGKNNFSSVSLDLSEKAFDWKSLENATKITSASSAAGKAVAYLMKACGYAVKMDYGTSSQSGSSANPSQIVPAMVYNFGYSSDMVFGSKAENSLTTWENEIQNELVKKHPIMYGGQGDNGGHRFILDGYDASTKKYHFNWGWSGQNDGYFSLTSLKPGNHNYNKEQTMVIYISPAAQETIAKPVILLNPYNDEMTLSCATDGVEFYYSFTPQDDVTTASYQRYYTSQKISIKCNGTFRAYVKKKGKTVEADAKTVSWFKVDKPEFYPDGNKITIKCPSATAIYYTKNGNSPTKYDTKYTSSFTVTNGTTIKAIGVKANYSNSAVAQYEYKEQIKTVYDITNVAGKISEQISNTDKLKVVSLTVRGKLNGTDIKFIGQMLTNGELSRLDMSNASIVTGGDSYWGTDTKTKTNEIGKYMFYGATKLTSIVLPANITKIGEHSFDGCSSLSNIEIPSPCTEIGYHAFKGTAITSLTIPQNVGKIDRGIVFQCKKLKNLRVASGNKTFDSRDNCNAIIETANNKVIAGCISTFIPASVQDIEMNAFCTSPAKLTIPGSIKKIQVYAFEDNEELEELIIEEGVNSLFSKAFYGCSNLKKVSIPSSVRYIYEEVFAGCKSLASVTVYSQTPVQINANVFSDSNVKWATLYVPYGCKTKYQSSTGWKDFRNIEEMYPVVNSIAELKELDDKTRAILNLNNAQVTYVSNYSGSSDHIYLRDKTGAYGIYEKDLVQYLGIKVGDYISGPIPIYKYDIVGGLVLTNELNIKDISKSGNQKVNPTIVSQDQLVPQNGFDLISIENVELYGNESFSFKSSDRYISIYPDYGMDPDTYMTILAAVKDKDLSGRLFNITGICDYNKDYDFYMIKLTQPIVEVQQQLPNIDFVSVTCTNSNPSELTQNDKLNLRAVFRNSGATAKVKTQLALLNKEATRIMYHTTPSESEFLSNRQYTYLYEYSLKDVTPGDYLATVMYYNESKKDWIYKYLTNVRIKAITGIDDVKIDDKNNNNRIFNMSGQKLDKPQKGINIINGRKVMGK